MHKRVEDLTGKVFNKLTVIEFAGIRNRNALWLCSCECGNTKITQAKNLKNNSTKSCGCLHKAFLSKNSASVLNLKEKHTKISEETVNDKCVYVHKLEGNIVYVGSGCLSRVRNNTTRSPEHLILWNLLDKEIVKDKLTEKEARELEQKIIDENWESGNLLNNLRKVGTKSFFSWKTFDELLEYDLTSKTLLRWKKPHGWNGLYFLKNIGDIAGWVNKSGSYNKLNLFGKAIPIHRVIYSMLNRIDLPDNMVIDHIDRDKQNNKIENLRMISYSENNLNRTKAKNITGHSLIAEQANHMLFIVKAFDIPSQIFSYNPKSRKNAKSLKFKDRDSALLAAIEYRDSFLVKRENYE